MANVRRDLSNLPSAGAKPARPPATSSIIVEQVANAWHQRYLTNGDAEYNVAIPGRVYRASYAGQRCDRQQYYALSDTPRTEPLSIASVWRMQLGNLVHDDLGEIMDALGNGWRAEIVVDLLPLGVNGSAHADLARFVCRHCDNPIGFVTIEPTKQLDDGNTVLTMSCPDEGCTASEPFDIIRTAKGEHTYDTRHERAADVVEFKTQGGYGFKMMATTQGGPPEGPRFGHVLQGAMCADGLECDRITVAYVSMENVSPKLAASYHLSEVNRFAAEWHFTRTQLRPLLDAEYARIARVMRSVEAGRVPIAQLVDPDYPVGATIVDPMRSRWQLVDPVTGNVAQTGQHPWICDYCDWRTQCVDDNKASDEPAAEPVV